MKRFATCAMVLALAASAAVGQVVIPSDGSDGAFAPTADVTVDLSLALSGATVDWQTPGTGDGVYDPFQWAVVFKYTTVNIPAGVTVTFTNHPSGAPVIWLAQGDVIIDGTVALNGVRGHHWNELRTMSEPGPGGFRGGRGAAQASLASGGFGPGAAGFTQNLTANSPGASHGEFGATSTGHVPGAIYGNAGVFPLVGGSGGAGGSFWNNGAGASGGGAGGGAILIATATIINLGGIIGASGGSGGANCCGGGQGGGGSGGSIRLVADSISGSGTLFALGGSAVLGGGVGRIRVEANSLTLVDQGNPPYTIGLPGTNPILFRDTATPAIRSVTLGGQAIPTDPRASLEFGGTDVSLTNSGLTELVITAENVPINTPLDASVVVRMVLATGNVTTVNAVYQSGTTASSTWTVDVDLPNGFAAFDVRAILP